MSSVNINQIDYRKVGRIYQNKDGNDFLISYNQDGLCSLNVDGILSYYESYDGDFTNNLLSTGKEISDNLQGYINGG